MRTHYVFEATGRTALRSGFHAVEKPSSLPAYLCQDTRNPEFRW